MRPYIAALAVWTAALLFTSDSLRAQAQARLTGTVTDVSGALVAGAQVAARNTATSATYSAVSSQAGVFSLPSLPSGEYELTCELAGFKKYRHERLVLETGIVRTVDIQLELGNLTETVQVTAAAPLLESETSTVGQFIERAMMVNMPLATRRSASLVRLMGAVVYSIEVAGHQVPRFSVAGGRSQNQMWYLDGGAAQNVALGNPSLEVNMPAEALQEFKAEVNNYSAEFGRTGGGLMLMTTRSGSNRFHGSAYEFFRNDRLDARTFFAASRAPLRYNIFGASAGGPIRRDRTFFFLNYEGTRRRDGVTLADSDVPHPAERTGDFSARRDLVLMDPGTRQPFPGNVIPAARLDPIGRQVASLWPDPNVPGNDVTRAPRDNFIANAADTLTRNVVVTRIDHTIGNNDRVYGRFLRIWGPLSVATIFPATFADFRGSSDDNRNTDFAGSWIHNLSPAVMNEFRYTYGGRYFSSVGAGGASGRNGELGLAGVRPDTFARFNVAGLTSLGSNNHGTLQAPITTQEFINNVTLAKGKHYLKTGVSARLSANQDDNDSVAGGRFTFTDRATGNGLATMLLGATTSADLIDGDVFNTRTEYYGAFLQDDWKLTSRFTLNLGIRWEMDTPRWEKNNQQSGFDPLLINPVSGTPGALVFSGRDGRGKYAHAFDKNNFSPRFGFAYRLRDSVVVRGGYGLSYYGAYGRSVVRALAQGFSLTGSFTSKDGGFTPAFPLRNGMPLIDRQDLGPGFGAVRLGQAPRLAADYFDPNHRSAYAQQWNLTIQKQLPGSLLLETAYLANVAHRLGGPPVSTNMIPLVNGRGPAQQDQRLRPFPQYSNVMLLTPPWGNSTYHALNIKLEKRYSHGLNLLANYTWSKFLDDVEGLNELAGEEGNGYTHLERRRLDKSISGNHVPHRLVVSTVYDLPAGKGRRWAPSSRFLEHVIGGWGAGLIAELRAGAPYGVIEQTNRTNTFSHAQRPNLLRNPELPGDRSRNDMLNRYFDTAAFQSAGVGQFGNAARNVGLGPGYMTFDVSLHKNWSLTERHRLQLRSDFFNLFNRPNFGSPALQLGRADFGRITRLAPGAIAREIQLSLRLDF